MIKSSAKARKKIKEIKNRIISLENGSEYDGVPMLSQEVRDLRDIVMYVHTEIELSLNSAIGGYLMNKLKLQANHYKPEDIHYFYRDLLVILDELDFSKKIKIVQTYKVWPARFIKNCYAVNQLRVKFAHTASYIDHLYIYNYEELYLDSLILLESTLDDLKKYYI